MYTLDHISQPLVFLHNARCGGNKLNFLFMQQYQAKHWFKLGDNLNEISKSFDDFIAAAKSPDIKLYLGHNVFGVHQFFDRSVNYISNFRDPIKRVISLYTRWLTPEQIGTSLPDFLAQDFEAFNGMTKRIAGLGLKDEQTYDYINQQAITPDHKVDEAVFEQALANLEQRIDDIILLEDLDASCIMLEHKYQLHPLFSIEGNHLNQSIQLKADPKTLPPEWLDWIINNNAYDIKLYAWVKKQFNAKKQALSSELKEQIRHRYLVTECLKYQGTNTIEFQIFIQKLEQLLTRLNAFGLKNDMYQVLTLFVNHPEMPKHISAQLINGLSNILLPEHLQQLRSAL